VVAATMLAEMPELGKLTTQTAAALAGVAPYNRDSGGQNGVRRINGGRAAVRCALYMATLSAVRHDRILKEFYLRLRAAGKKPLVAMTACMRKLVILMNRLLKYHDFQLAS
jgi:transposase